MINSSFSAFCVILILFKVDGQQLVDMTILETAVEKGAVCLDGSAPAYHFDQGFGAGIKNWIVFLQGGAWCNVVSDCKGRSNGWLGSSKHMNKSDVQFYGMLHNQSEFNPDFYNWNRIEIRYCDGASFTGEVEAVDPVNNLYFRGARIFKAMVDELLAKGMNNAEKVLLSGCSAGGLSVILNCDRFAKILSSNNSRIDVKCIADAGYFVNIKDLSGAPRVETYYDQVVSLHGSEKYLPDPCTSTMKPGLCFFPQNMVRYIQTPIFFVNPAYDVWQIGMNYAPDSVAPPGFLTCKNNLANCTAEQLKIIQQLEVEFLNGFKEGVSSLSATPGYFINGCYTHCQTDSTQTWLSANSPALNGKKIAHAVGDWVLNRTSFEVYGSPYPYDTTCHNFVKQDN